MEECEYSMGKITIDFRFSEINYELWALSEYLEFMERHLPNLSETERKRILSSVYSNLNHDNGEIQLAYQIADDIETSVLPRHFRAPFVISLWSVFEAAIREISEYIQEKQNQSLGLNDIRGDFLSRVEKYYHHVLQYEICIDGTSWEQIKIIALVRNIFAHANGRKSAIEKGTWNRLENWINENGGLHIDGDFVIPSAAFVRNSYNVIFSLLDDLMNRVKTGYS